MDNAFWKILDEVKKSIKAVEVLPVDNSGKEASKKLYNRNPGSLSAILLEHTGGIVIDHWIRFYGTGEINFAARNHLVPICHTVIAEDILGGLFMFLDNGKIGYFAPDCLELENMDIDFYQFFYWCLHGDTDTFYRDYRWKNWQKDVSKLKTDEGVAFYPFLWSGAKNLESRSRQIVPIDEIIGLEFDFLRQMQEA